MILSLIFGIINIAMNDKYIIAMFIVAFNYKPIVRPKNLNVEGPMLNVKVFYQAKAIKSRLNENNNIQLY
jgi:hypothetical protein